MKQKQKKWIEPMKFWNERENTLSNIIFSLLGWMKKTNSTKIGNTDYYLTKNFNESAESEEGSINYELKLIYWWTSVNVYNRVHISPVWLQSTIKSAFYSAFHFNSSIFYKKENFFAS